MGCPIIKRDVRLRSGITHRNMFVILTNIAIFYITRCLWNSFTRYHNLLPDSSNKLLAPQIAIGIQGKSEQIDTWQKVFKNMPKQSQIDLFCLVYDGIVDLAVIAVWERWLLEPNTSLRRLIVNSSTTWTTGRNMLAQAI